jgi:hypothetical protein
MNNKSKFFKILSLVLGVIILLIFVLDFIFLESIRPRMIEFDEITDFENTLLTFVGVGLLLILCYFFISLWGTVRYLRFIDHITFPIVLLLVTGVLAFLFVFSDIALLQDIVKQYEGGFDQPEWALVYPILGGQALVAVVYLYLHITGTLWQKKLDHIAKDSNIFFAVQYVGVICGLAGLASNSLGFFFTKAWSPVIHSVIGSVILISPYVMAVAYWFLIKVNENDEDWYDEKQILDVGRSAFLTLIITTIVMMGLYIPNFQHLDGIIRVLWLPLFIFTEILVFSSGNIYFGSKP